MINFRFKIDDLVIEEPMGFSDIVIEMNRDEQWHGVFIEASTSDLRFYGPAAAYLMDKKQTLGLKSQVIFLAEAMCDGELEYSVILQGKLNFRRYKESCGASCWVSLNVEQDNCVMTLRNRYDQKVDVGSDIAFDKITQLPTYSFINQDMELPAKDLPLGTQGDVVLGGYETDGSLIPLNFDENTQVVIRPVYGRKRNESILTTQLEPASEIGTGRLGEQMFGISPVLLLEEIPICISDPFDIEIRLKGSLNLTLNGDFTISSFDYFIRVFETLGDEGMFVSTTSPDYIELMKVTKTAIVTGGHTITGDFDESFSGSVNLRSGYSLHALVQLAAFSRFTESVEGGIIWDEETRVDITVNKSCIPTTSKVSGLQETLSRITEAITIHCLKVKTDYYGRTDSEPYPALVDGCGGLRVLTNGLHIRKDANARFFASLKEVYEGLKAIDNIGMGIEPDPNRPGFDWLRIEDVGYFYQNDEVLRLPFVPSAEIAIDESKHYSIIKVGYKKWEVERVNGLDEPNSNKEYRTGLSSVNNTLDITSNLISGSYPIEITRQQSFAASGGADTKYDNDIFIICMKRGVYGFTVEQGNVTNPANVYSPQTLYNWRIRPYTNLMRWFKSIVNSYPNMTDTDNKLYFSAGTGNYLAEGEMTDPNCKLERAVKAENDDLWLMDFIDANDAIPLVRPETARLKYPMSVAMYKSLKAKPYSYISFQCGTDEQYLKGYVKQVQYKPTKGEAELTLILSWQ